jgi:HTH-type transcriptional regulator/antitoxin HigA
MPLTTKKEAGELKRARRANSTYLALFRTFPIRPIRSENELDEAIAVVRDLFCRREPLNAHEQDYLDVLSHEIERYEAEAYPIPRVSEAAMLRHLLDAQGVSLSAAAEATGIATSTLSAVSNGKRKLNVKHIRQLSAYFGVEPGVFLE